MLQPDNGIINVSISNRIGASIFNRQNIITKNFKIWNDFLTH